MSNETMPLSGTHTCQSLVHSLADEFVSKLPEGVAGLFNHEAFKTEAAERFFNRKMRVKNPEYNPRNTSYGAPPEYLTANYSLFEALLAEYTYPLFNNAIKEMVSENSEVITEQIKVSLSEVGVLSHVMPGVIGELTAVVVNAAVDAATKHVANNLLAVPSLEPETGRLNNISLMMMSGVFSGRTKFDWSAAALSNKQNQSSGGV